MTHKGLIKRVLPFVATFAVGLFVASFFVSVSAPHIGFRGRGWERHRRFEQLQIENEELRNENLRLRNENGGSRFHSGDFKHIDGEDWGVPEVTDIPMPPPPPAPRAHR